MAIDVDARAWAQRQLRQLIANPILKVHGYDISKNQFDELVRNALYGNHDEHAHEDLDNRIQKLFLKISEMRDSPIDIIANPINDLLNRIFEVKNAFVNPIEMYDGDVEMREVSITLDERDPSITLNELRITFEILSERKELNELIIKLNPLAEAILKNILVNLNIWEVK
jgi:hypothetical protein